jgi:hypothetical protein
MERITKTVRIHAVENLKRIRDVMNRKIQPPPTVEEVLASESARLGVPLTVKKGDADDSP